MNVHPAIGASVPRSLPALLLLALALPTPAHAKDLRNHFGVGFSASLPLGSPAASTELPGLSLKYGFPTGNAKMNVALQADIGLAWTTDQSPALYAGGRLSWGVVAEDNMNLFLGLGGGYHAEGDASFARVQPVLGAEFFLFGLENLGITTELGLNVDVGAATHLATAPGLQVHYYF